MQIVYNVAEFFGLLPKKEKKFFSLINNKCIGGPVRSDDPMGTSDLSGLAAT